MWRGDKMKLQRMRTISGKIDIVTGLHIGASNEAIEIGGLDQPVIKNPLNDEPYIPGSSLKGKMRSLIEIKEGRFVSGKGSPCECGEKSCPVCPVFGVSASSKHSEDLGPTRIIVRDANLTPEWQERFQKGELPMEIKYENIINRISGTAEHPRPLERVPAGVTFDFNISFKVFEGDSDQYFQTVLKAMRMLELDALGGSGSRGCGQIKFLDVMIDGEKKVDDFIAQINPN